MSGRIDKRLKELGIELPKLASPVANYVPYVITGNLLFISGQITLLDGEIKYKGKVGKDIGVEDAYKAARLCGLNVLAHARAACGGDLDRIKRCVKLVGFINCDPDFYDHPKVVNGGSDLMVDVLGEAGRHARSAVASPALPFNVAVELEAVFEIA